MWYSPATLETPQWAPDPPRGSPSLAAFLSFLWPGLGQLYAGKRRLAAVFAALAVLVTLIVLYQARQGIAVLVARFIEPDFAFKALVLVVLVGILRVVAVVHAYYVGGASRSRRRRDVGVLGLLLVVILATHGLGAYAAYSDYSTMSSVFGDTQLPNAGQSLAPGASGPIADGTLEPAVTPTPGGRVTILLAGVDSYVGRGERLYDSIMVVSIDRASGKVAMVSVPRDSSGYPLYFGGTGGVKINALVTYVQNGWIKSPDSAMTTFIKEIGYLVGVPINYYATVDLAGFMKLIDMVGGVDINNPTAINDPSYDWLDGVHHGYSLSAGPHHLDGKNALAYVRSRHGSGNNDWKRASRQQEVLVSLEHKMASPDMLFKLPDFMQTVAATMRTNYPAGQVADMVAFGQSIPKENISQVVLGPPYSDTNTSGTTKIWTSCLRLDKIAPLSVQLFGTDSRYSGMTQKNVCP